MCTWKDRIYYVKRLVDFSAQTFKDLLIVFKANHTIDSRTVKELFTYISKIVLGKPLNYVARILIDLKKKPRVRY